MTYGAADGALKDAPLFGRAHQGKGIARVQMVVAEQKIERAVVFRRARLRNDLDAAPAWSGIISSGYPIYKSGSFAPAR